MIIFQGEFEIKTKFWGKSIELLLMGCESLKMHAYDEEYRWVGWAEVGHLAWRPGHINLCC